MSVHPVHSLLPLLLAGVLALPAAHAATFAPTRFDDPLPGPCLPGDCSLREAVAAANASAAQDTIVLERGDYVLDQSSGPDAHDLDIAQPLHIVGQGASKTTIRFASFPGPDARVLEVRETTLELASLTVRDGETNGPFGSVGGCIYAYSARLGLDHVNVQDCTAHGPGGGMLLTNAVADFSDVEISGNTAAFGGGIAMQGKSSIRAVRTRVAENEALEFGGALAAMWFTPSSSQSFYFGERVSFDANEAPLGGAIATSYGTSLLLEPLVSGTMLEIESNVARDFGGGFWVSEPVGSVAAGTMRGHGLALRSNLTKGSGGGGAAFGRVRLYDSEVRDNVAQLDGGGILIERSAPRSILERVALTTNLAGGFGGGAFVAGEQSLLRNVSSFANEATTGGGFHVEASTQMTHVTSFDELAAAGSSLNSLSSVELRGSVLTSGCATSGSGAILDVIGNIEAAGTPSCGLASHPVSAFALAYASFGGSFDVVGIVGSSSVLVDALPQQPNASLDVRGWARGALADSGAFEFGATP